MSTLESIARERAAGKRIGFTCSSFDLLHAGHVAMLMEAKQHCDYLVVGLLADPTLDRPDTKNKPVQSMFERWMQVQAVKYVDAVIPFSTEQDIVDMLLVLEPDVRIVGEDYRSQNFTGSYLPVNVHFNSRRHSFSTTDLRYRVKVAEEKKNGC